MVLKWGIYPSIPTRKVYEFRKLAEISFSPKRPKTVVSIKHLGTHSKMNLTCLGVKATLNYPRATPNYI
jgi:hypothetical protein